MKKLKLKLHNVSGVELLTREQLKIVMGGSGTGDADCICSFYCDGQFRGTNYGSPSDCFDRAQESYWCPSGNGTVSYSDCSGSVTFGGS